MLTNGFIREISVDTCWSTICLAIDTPVIEPLQQAIGEGDILGAQVIRITTDLALADLKTLRVGRVGAASFDLQ